MNEVERNSAAESAIRPVIALALRYFGVIFALGFVLGTIRVLWLTPRIGARAAVLTEVPILLMASWVWARRLLARQPLPGRLAALAMGLLAFVLLIATEYALARWGFGQSSASWLRNLGSTPGMIGLGGQLCFGLIPALVWRPA